MQVKSRKKKEKNYSLIQDESDEDDSDDNLFSDKKYKNTLKEKSTGDHIARHLTFQLELVFVNKLIKKFSKDMLSMMLSFEGHPRDKKGGGKKKQVAHPKLQDCLESFR